ncbi:MAG: ABC transporter substrate-binding protein [Chloroflexota bacterium]
MRTSKLLLLTSFGKALGLLFAGCAPAVSPTATAKPVPAPTKPAAAPKAPAPATAVSKPAPATAAPKPAPATAAPKPAAPSPSPKPAADQPKYGGTLNRSIRAEIPHFDFQAGSSSTHIHPIVPAYNGLIQYDPMNPGEIIADLAEKWSVSTDGFTCTFNLRKGVKWHDGNPFTASDVLVNLERLKKNVHAGPGLEPVKSAEAVDDYTVKVVLSYPSAGMFDYLATGWGSMFPKHILQAKGNMKNDVMGTGAFKFSRFDRGVSIELEKNANYFIPGRPYVDRIRTYFIADEASAIAALRTGRIDYMIWLSDPGAMRIRETYKAGTTAQCRGSQFRAIYLPVDKPPFNDVRVRRAVHLAIDRQAALKVISEGIGDLGGVIPEALGGIPLSDLLKRPGYRQPKDQDIAEAKKLLAEAGYASGFKTSTLHRKGLEYEVAAVFMKDQLAKIGIDVTLKTMDDAAYYEIREKRGYDTFCTRHSMSVNDSDLLLKKWFKSGSTENWSNFSDPELDRLIELQSKEQDKEKRKALVRQANERLEELAPAVMLFWSGYWRACGPRVKNFVMPAQHYDGEKFVDTWLSE